MLLGFVVLGAALWVELSFAPSIWVHVVAWPILILALGLPVMRFAKAFLLAQTFARDAGQGRLEGDMESRN